MNYIQILVGTGWDRELYTLYTLMQFKSVKLFRRLSLSQGVNIKLYTDIFLQ